MADQGLYRDVLLDHYRHPRNRCEDGLEGADITRRGSNPRCGDEIEVGLYLDEDRLAQVRFRGHGCSVCIASASMMTQAVRGHTRDEAQRLCQEMGRWFGQGEGEVLPSPPEGLRALSAVREYPARRRCVAVSWEALAAALDGT